MKKCIECQTTLVYDDVMGRIPSEYLRCPSCGNRYKIVFGSKAINGSEGDLIPIPKYNGGSK